jgi:ABC-2 type transport system ATP-binding protein
MEFAIQTEQLSRTYKIRGSKNAEARELIALQGVDLEVKKGELKGILGPNGAGKTTLIKILTTLLAPSQGSACVAGFDVVKEPEKIRPRINMVSGGESSGYGLLTVRENLWMFSQFYGMDSKEANQRIKDLLEIVGLGNRINTKSSDLSTGLRQNMNIVRGFLTDPEILFLDEPTLGLDVGAARDVRNFVRRWIDSDASRTLLLTTHYMVEANELCDRVAIINQGRVLACDTPASLKHRLQQDAIFQLEVSPLNGLGVDALEALPGVKKVSRHDFDGGARLEFILVEEPVVGTVINKLTAENVRVLNFQKREPTLEDVFIDLVGRSMAEEEHSDG